jgi:hypothetical protein
LDAAGERLVNRLLKSPAMQSEREALQAILNSRKLGSFEQESLGRPTQREWPFYSLATIRTAQNGKSLKKSL